ncbi:type II secretion system protein [Aliarcobacter butzleri]|uniref:type II secretion system protein n=1 Tax=Aliarcobacter butzleri TaxID=28197 RepID=UPI0024DE6DC0|nr:type II secretion system protein [Aliarcobacter butzleri]MDK2063321.1 type II secretion system protein [Aliarcobacter butzleri]
MSKTKKGYTLIEMLFVLTIITILSGAVIQTTQTMLKYAVKQGFVEDLLGIIKIQEYIKLKEGDYVYFSHLTTEKNEVINLSDFSSLNRSDYKATLRFSNTKIEIKEDELDRNCFILESEFNNLKTFYNNCTSSKLDILEIDN